MRPPPDFGGAFRTDERARAAYAEGAGIFRIIPAAVAFPRSPADLQALVAWARAEGVGLVPRGAGSAMGGGSVGPGVIADLTALEDRTCRVDPAAARARTAAAITLRELNEQAMLAGLRYPPVPSSWRWATAGGVVACNAAGAATLRYGPARRWVTGLDLVTGEGERVTLRRGHPAAGPERFEREVAPAIRSAAPLIEAGFPKVTKNTAGYALDQYLLTGDALDLVVGAEGTLGFVTAVEWRLDQVPAATVALRVDLPSLDALAPAVEALLRCSPSAVELLDRTFLDLVRESSAAHLPPAGTEAVLLVEIERPTAAAARGAVGDAVRLVSPLALNVETALEAGEVERAWALRHAASPILARQPVTHRSMQVIEDGCVPVPALGAYVRFIRERARDRGLDVVLFGHAGDGHLHVNLLPDTTAPGWEGNVRGLLEEVTAEVIRLGGTPSGEHGDGRLRARFVERLYGGELMALFRQVKAAFDPDGVLNPGVKLPAVDGAAEFGPLKVGAAAAPLPPDIETALRRIEREGGYGESRIGVADGAVEGARSKVEGEGP
ncbi:MAG TPA: FAD-binding oxidoreductase [Gemmatimonadales bacterium]|nr:FAD-binding oxidoreductase [Gemmatimonadales bacterium]